MKRLVETIARDVLRVLLEDLFRRRPVQKPPPAAPGAVVVGRCRKVVDGDSLWIRGVETQVRLWGVDAPETDEPGYDAARAFLARLVRDEDVRVEPVALDKYGRLLARCYLPDGREINRLMIESGTAREYCRFTDNHYGTCR